MTMISCTDREARFLTMFKLDCFLTRRVIILLRVGGHFEK